MKKSFLLLALTFALSVSLFAQKSPEPLFLKKFTSGIDVYNDIVMKSPEGIKFRAINPGVSFYGLHTFPIKKSNFAFAIGVGIGMHNLFSNATLSDSASTSSFIKIPSEIKYKKSKLGLTYLDVPAELCFKTEGGFKLAVGAKVGMLLDAHTKYKGNDADGKKMKTKEKELANIEKVRFGPTFKIGYKWIDLNAFYSVTKVFTENSGIGIYPLSVGISLRPF